MTLTIAVPKGRILEELLPVFDRMKLKLDASFYDENSRALHFDTNEKGVSVIRVRSFDVVTFVAFGAAQLGIAGSDVLMEMDSPNVYAPLDLGIGKCRISVAREVGKKTKSSASHIRVATKYPNVAKQFFADKGVQAECIKLNGAMELSPKLGLSEIIVDLVSSGKTLKENGLIPQNVSVSKKNKSLLNTLEKTSFGKFCFK
jgi:ATP phosphoribosyltransferase